LDIYPYGAVTIEEEEPIVAVTVIGSGCSGQGYVWLEAEPLEWKYPRTGVRMMTRDLWGIHLRYDGWAATDESWNDAGMSSARFDLPDCRKVIVGGGSCRRGSTLLHTACPDRGEGEPVGDAETRRRSNPERCMKNLDMRLCFHYYMALNGSTSGDEGW